MFEKRAHERSPIEMAASYGIGDESDLGNAASINNMSAGGFCLTLEKKLSVGEKIQLSIDLDTSKDALLWARVVWVKKIDGDSRYTIGVEIIEKRGSDYDRFLNFFNQQV